MAGALADVFPDGTEAIGAIAFKPLLAPKKEAAASSGSRRKKKRKRPTRRTNKTQIKN